VLSKHGEFSFFFPQNMVTLYIALIKKSFVGFALPFFWWPSGNIWPKKDTLVGGVGNINQPCKILFINTPQI
jgi:hypothetical protein